MCEVCVLCFSEDSSGDFSPRGVFIFFKRSPPTFELPRGDRFPQKIYIPPRGELRGCHGRWNSDKRPILFFIFFKPANCRIRQLLLVIRNNTVLVLTVPLVCLTPSYDTSIVKVRMANTYYHEVQCCATVRVLEYVHTNLTLVVSCLLPVYHSAHHNLGSTDCLMQLVDRKHSTRDFVCVGYFAIAYCRFQCGTKKRIGL